MNFRFTQAFCARKFKNVRKN